MRAIPDRITRFAPFMLASALGLTLIVGCSSSGTGSSAKTTATTSSPTSESSSSGSTVDCGTLRENLTSLRTALSDSSLGPLQRLSAARVALTEITEEAKNATGALRKQLDTLRTDVQALITAITDPQSGQAPISRLIDNIRADIDTTLASCD